MYTMSMGVTMSLSRTLSLLPTPILNRNVFRDTSWNVLMSASSRSTLMTLPKVTWGAVTVESAWTTATTSPASGGSSASSGSAGCVVAMGPGALSREGRGGEEGGSTAPLLALSSSPPLPSPVGHWAAAPRGVPLSASFSMSSAYWCPLWVLSSLVRLS